MRDRELRRLGEKTVNKVMKHWGKFDRIDKKQFEEGVDIIIRTISKNTNTAIPVIAQHTHSVIEEFTQEYPQVPDNIKSHEAIIMMLYLKYMEKLGLVENRPVY